MSGDLALDFGTARTRVMDEDGALLLEEPTLAAVDQDTGSLLAFGAAARTSGAAAAGRVHLLRPVRRGQLVDLPLAEEILAEVLRRVGASRLLRPRLLVCAHPDATPVQRRAMERALTRANARSVHFVEQPVAVAVGAGLPIEEPSGSMVAEVGAGTTDLGLLALGGLVTWAAPPLGGDDFSECVRGLLGRRHRLVVDEPTAAEVLRVIGTVDPEAPELRVEVLGRDLSTGRPAAAVLARSALRAALLELLAPVLAAAVRCITEAPPDLANDLLGSGLLLAGGGSLLEGLDRCLANATGLAVHLAPSAHHCAVLGASRCLASLAELPAAGAGQRR